MPFSISYNSPTVHKVQNSQAYNVKYEFFIDLLFLFCLENNNSDPDPGKSSESMRIRIRNADLKGQPHEIVWPARNFKLSQCFK